MGLHSGFVKIDPGQYLELEYINLNEQEAKETESS